MKNLFTLLLFFVSANLIYSQIPSLKLWTLNSAGTSTVLAVNQGDIIPYTVMPFNTKIVKMRFMNRTAITNTYSVARYDKYLNAGAVAYFCFGPFGNVFPPSTTVCPVSDQVVLMKDSVNNNFVADLDEGPAQGYSLVKYILFNVNNAADTLSFSIVYNQATVVNEAFSFLESVSNVYPNPAQNETNVNITLVKESDIAISIINNAGQVVISQNASLSAGSNNVNIDTRNLAAGIYNVLVASKEGSTVKKLTVTK
jgi:hypothetical protein